MSGWLSLSLWIVFMSLNILDVAMTRTALRKGYHELMHLTRALIEELGLDKAMLVKSLFPLGFLIPIIFFWNDPLINLILDIGFTTLTIWYSIVVLHDWKQLATKRVRLK
jgi:hypothetical protein